MPAANARTQEKRSQSGRRSVSPKRPVPERLTLESKMQAVPGPDIQLRRSPAPTLISQALLVFQGPLTQPDSSEFGKLQNSDEFCYRAFSASSRLRISLNNVRNNRWKLWQKIRHALKQGPRKSQGWWSVRLPSSQPPKLSPAL